MIQVEVFWVMALCGDVAEHQHFRGPCCLQLQGIPMKCWYHVTALCGITTQKTSTWIFSTMKTSDLTVYNMPSFVNIAW